MARRSRRGRKVVGGSLREGRIWRNGLSLRPLQLGLQKGGQLRFHSRARWKGSVLQLRFLGAHAGGLPGEGEEGGWRSRLQGEAQAEGGNG